MEDLINQKKEPWGQGNTSEEEGCWIMVVKMLPGVRWLVRNDGERSPESQEQGLERSEELRII